MGPVRLSLVFVSGLPWSDELSHPNGATTATDAVLIADDERRFVDANDAACALLGFDREELLKLRVDDIASPELAPEVERMWVDFLAQRRLSGVFAVRTAAGETRVVHFAALADFPLPGIHLSRLRPVDPAPPGGDG